MIFAKVPAITQYPAAFGWIFGPTGGGAHIHVHAQMRETLRGSAGVKTVVWNAAMSRLVHETMSPQLKRLPSVVRMPEHSGPQGATAPLAGFTPVSAQSTSRPKALAASAGLKLQWPYRT